MGYKNRTEQETTHSNNSSSLCEAMLFATMCIIGLPVDVHVKDGSVYSGIFYTASVEKDYGEFFYFFIYFEVWSFSWHHLALVCEFMVMFLGFFVTGNIWVYEELIWVLDFLHGSVDLAL